MPIPYMEYGAHISSSNANGQHWDKFITIVHELDVVSGILCLAQQLLIAARAQLRTQSAESREGQQLISEVIALAENVTNLADNNSTTGTGSDDPTVDAMITSFVTLTSWTNYIRSFHYVAVGDYYLLSDSAPDRFHAMYCEDLEDYIARHTEIDANSLSNFRTAHSMIHTYAAFLLPLLSSQSVSVSYSHEEPGMLVLPLPSILRITLSQTQTAEYKNEALVTLHGRNLYSLRHVRSSQLKCLPKGNWKIDHFVDNSNLRDSNVLSFKISKNPSLEHTQETAVPIPTRGVTILASSFFCASGAAEESVSCSDIPVRVTTHHPCDEYSLPKLISAALVFLLFVAERDHEMFERLQEIIEKVSSK